MRPGRIFIYLLFFSPVLLAQNRRVESREPLQLSLKRAVELATSPDGSAKIRLSGEMLKQAQMRAAQARAALLPNLDAVLSEQSRMVNLASNGFSSSLFKIPGISFSMPSVVGPFTNMDARLNLAQSVFDISSIRRFQASRVGILAAKSELETTEEQVAAQTARAYLAGIRADAEVETALANVNLSQAMLTQAENQKKAGTGTGIEITRARVQLANDRQRLLVMQNSRRSAHLQLLRIMGLQLDVELELIDKLAYIPVDTLTLEEAKAQALKARPDLQAQQEREANARLTAGATRLERLPSVTAFADYGSVGTGLNNAVPTRDYGISLKIPLFDGGRRDARRAETVSQYRTEKIRTSDLKEQIELDVRLALDGLRSAEDQVKVSREGLDLADNELTHARRRYQAGMTDSLEVTDAQTRLERARDNQTQALYNYNLARIDLAQAMGAIRRTIQ
jgi:outer membrane protein